MTALLYFLIATFIAFGATRVANESRKWCPHLLFGHGLVVVFIVRMLHCLYYLD